MNLKEYVGIDLEIGDTFLSKSKGIEYKVDFIDYPKEIIIFNKKSGGTAKLSFSFIKTQLESNNWNKIN